MWDLIVLIPDHCLSFYYTLKLSLTLLHSERPNLYAILAFLSAIELKH